MDSPNGMGNFLCEQIYLNREANNQVEQLRSGFSSCSQPKIDFNEVFSRDVLTAEGMLEMQNIVDEVKASSDTFSSLIKARPDLVKQFADYALRPEAIQDNTGVFPVTYPFMCMEILCCQTEQFLDFVLQPLQKPTGDLVNSEQSESSIFKYMLTFLKTTQRVNETAAGYLLRFVSQLQYQRGSELFHFFEEEHEIFQRLISHSYSKSIAEVFSKLLSVDSEQTTPKKLTLINNVVKSLAQQTREKELSEKLENVVYMFSDLAEKCQERYDGKRYTSLMASSISVENCKILAEVLLSKCQIEDILLAGLDIFTVFLTFYKTDKAKRARKSSDNNESNMVSEEIQEAGNTNNDALLKIESFTNSLLQKFEGHELNIDWTKQTESQVGSAPSETIKEQAKLENQKNHAQTPVKINIEQKLEVPYPVSNDKSEKEESMLLEDQPTKTKFRFSQLKLFSLVQDLIILEPKNSSFEQDLLTAAFVRYACKLMRDHPNNNLMHNTLKNILVKGVKGKSSTAQVICSTNSGLIQFILDSSVAKPSHQPSYMNQLYHIATAIEEVRLKDDKLSENITKDYAQWASYVSGTYTERRKTYNRLLGDEDPKKKSDICMFGFYNRPTKPSVGVRVEVEEVKPYNFNGKGELGDDDKDDLMDDDFGLEIESDDDKQKKSPQTKSKRREGGGALCALLNKQEVTSEDEDTVRIEDDIPTIPIKMEIQENSPEHIPVEPQKAVEKQIIQPINPPQQAQQPKLQESKKEEAPKAEETELSKQEL